MWRWRRHILRPGVLSVAGGLLAGAALVTGALAGLGTLALTVIDRTVFITEVTGNQAINVNGYVSAL